LNGSSYLILVLIAYLSYFYSGVKFVFQITEKSKFECVGSRELTVFGFKRQEVREAGKKFDNEGSHDL